MGIIIIVNPDPYGYTLNSDNTTDEDDKTVLDDILRKYSGAWEKLA